MALKQNTKLLRITLSRLPTLLYIGMSVLITIILIQSSDSVYEAGTGDHLVISPAGLLRADPSLYVNDYFIRSARMPHWTFELYTAIASEIGLLGTMYFLYWLTAISFCAYAQLLIARKITNRLSYSLAFVMLTTLIVGNRMMFGTSAVILNQALPHSLAAAIGFLIFAAMFTNKRHLVVVLLPLIPLVHIQIGTIIVGLVLVWVLFERFSGQEIGKTLFVSFAISLLGIGFSLWYRPIAGNIKDFSHLCRDLIPHHCYAPSWSNTVIMGSCIILAIAVIGLLFINKSVMVPLQRIVIYLLPMLALSFSLLLDRNNVSWLADVVRGNNVYRVAVVLLPWLYWVPVFIICSPRRRNWQLIGGFISIVLLIKLLSLKEHGNIFESKPEIIILLFSIIALVLLADQFNWVLSKKTKSVIVLSFLFAAALFGSLSYDQNNLSLPNVEFQPDSYRVLIGEALHADVTAGQIVVGDPTLSWMRMASGVAYGVDCKFRPIGGGAPLYEFYKRIDPLGGYEQACNFGSFVTASIDALTDYYHSSRADLLLLSSNDTRLSGLLDRGWKKEGSQHLLPFEFVLVRQS